LKEDDTDVKEMLVVIEVIPREGIESGESGERLKIER
jgi:hypothetical protein